MTLAAAPPLGLGCAAIGGLHGPVPATEANATLQAAWQSGIRCFDTAPLYGAGHGETLLGQFLGTRTQPSTISTKIGWRIESGRCVTDYSYDGVIQTFQTSLLRLGLPRVDAVYIHDVDPYNHGEHFPQRFEQAMTGALPALRALQAAGLVGAIGIAVNDPAVCVAALARADFDHVLIAGRYTLVDQAAAAELLPLCAARGVSVIVGAPFNTGILAGSTRFRHRSPPSAVVTRVQALEHLCTRFGVSLGAAALQFPLRHPAVIRVLAGCRSAAQVQRCATWQTTPIPDSFWHAFQETGLACDAAGPIVHGDAAVGPPPS